MERRRVAVVLAGLVLVGGAVIALRLASGPPSTDAAPPAPPLPTRLRSFSAVGVLPPAPGGPPARPAGLTVTPGPHRLQVSWAAAPGATGYDVHWGTTTAPDRDVLVGEPDAEIDGLAPGTPIHVRVQSVDAFGQRSVPVTVSGQALAYPPPGADNAFTDHFDGPVVPDPRSWALADVNGCAQAGRGVGTDRDRLVVLTQCGQMSATLRAKAPFRIVHSGPELGRFTIETDAPGESGELDVDLVPGDVAMIDGSANDPITPTPANVAAVDGDLPPGTIRVRIAASVDSATSTAADTVQVAAGPGTPTVPVAAARARPIPAPHVGMSVRWDVILRADGVRVLRDGVYVGGGNVVPQWTQATALVEFSGPSLQQQRYDVNMIGFGGAPTSAPPAATPPNVVLGSFTDVAPGAAATAVTSQDTGPGSGSLLMTVTAAPNGPTSDVTLNGQPPRLAVRVGGTTFAANPAVPGTPLLSQVRYPLVARIPASVLRGVRSLPITLVLDAPQSYEVEVGLVAAELDVTPGPGMDTPIGSTAAPSLTVAPQLAMLTAQVFDASGDPLPQGASLPRGRAVLDVGMDAVVTQRSTGQQAVLAGVAGFEVWLDGVELVAVPTTTGGPAVGGDWRIAFDPSHGTPGTHTIDVRGYSTEHGVDFTETFASYELG